MAAKRENNHDRGGFDNFLLRNYNIEIRECFTPKVLWVVFAKERVAEAHHLWLALIHVLRYHRFVTAQSSH